VTRILWAQPSHLFASADSNASRAGSLPIKASGVEFIHTAAHGQRHRVHIGKEVVLAAGAIGSPKVLELSGVGNSTYVRFLPPLSLFLLLGGLN